MKLPSPLWYALRWCASSVLLLACWGSWLVLAALLGLQVWVAVRREVALPDFALRMLERRLGASEITATVDRAVLDPGGAVSLENVRLFAAGHQDPLVTVRAVYGRIDFWALVVGDLRLQEIRVTGADLWLPAMLSPSGMNEAVVSDLDGVFRLRRRDYDIDLCRFHVAGVAVTATGSFHLPANPRARSGTSPLIDLLLQRYLAAGRRLIAFRPRLAPLEEPRLELQLQPSAEHGAVVRAELFTRSYRDLHQAAVGSAHARTEFPLLGDSPQEVHTLVEAEALDWQQKARLASVRAEITGTLVPDRFAYHPLSVRLTAAGVDVLGLPLAAPIADLRVDALPQLQGRASFRLGDSAASAEGVVDVRAGSASALVTGLLTPGLLQLAGDRFKIASARKVSLAEPVSIQARVEVAPGWKPARLEADGLARHVIAQSVALDSVSGHAELVGHHLEVTDIAMMQGENRAYGTYQMDTATRDYRFLLQGRMRPADIAGWFKPSWLKLWKNFDFSAVPPDADVDVQGRWGAAHSSSVFCWVDAAKPGIRGVGFDRIRISLFFRPNYFDAAAFTAEQHGRAARGSFLLTLDPGRSIYRTLDFSAVSDLDITECAAIYGAQGTDLAAPYEFAEPPHVQASGHFEGPSVPGGPHRKVTGTVASSGRFALSKFPVERVRFHADYRDDDLDLDDIEAIVAGGTATGTARVSGPKETRRLAFDGKLTGADLVRLIGIVDEFQSLTKPGEPGRPKPQFLSKAAGSRLDLSLKAEGRFGQFYTFHGDGNAHITGKQLGEIHLLGALSEVLSKTLLSFTSLRIDTVQAGFKLDGNKVHFPQVKLQGRSASIDAHGDYLLDAKTLDFNARVFPLQESKTALPYGLGLLLSPLSNVLELKLTGPIDKPSWAFVYGPTNLLRLLTQPSSGNPPYPPAGESGPQSEKSPPADGK